MKILLDTTYLLPVIGISVKGFPNDIPIRLRHRGNHLFISEISIFELSAKGAKYVNIGKLSVERVVRGIRAIVFDENLIKIPIYEDSVLLTACKLRNLLNDFIDCLILSSAISQCDILMSEDTDIQNLRNSKEFQDLLKMMNPRFKIHNLTEIVRM